MSGGTDSLRDAEGVYVTPVRKSEEEKTIYQTHLPTYEFVWKGSFVRKVTDEYRKWLSDFLGYGTDKVLRFDVDGFKSYKCTNGSCGVRKVHLPMVDAGKYHPYQSHKHSSRCGSEMADKLEYFQKNTSADYLVTIDLTMEREMSESLATKDKSQVRDAIHKFLKKLHDYKFHDKKSKFGGFYALHLWKTTKPLDPHVHVHLNLVNVCYDGKRFHRFKPWLNIKRVKKAWAEALHEVGLWGRPVGLPDVHVGYIKLTETPRIIHRIKYCYRKPLVDLNKNIGNCPNRDRVDEEWGRLLLNYTPRRCYVGWLVNTKRFGYSSSHKSFSPKCPVCGSDLVFVENVWELDGDIPWYYTNRRGELEKCGVELGNESVT